MAWHGANNQRANRAGVPGEQLMDYGAIDLKKGGPSIKTSPVLAWEDWTGGLGTTDRVAEPAPFGVGTPP